VTGLRNQLPRLELRGTDPIEAHAGGQQRARNSSTEFPSGSSICICRAPAASPAIGIPTPEIMGPFVGYVEIIGGVLVLLGLPNGQDQEPGGWNRLVLKVTDLPACIAALKSRVAMRWKLDRVPHWARSRCSRTAQKDVGADCGS
jgi:hypothetical protein